MSTTDMFELIAYGSKDEDDLLKELASIRKEMASASQWHNSGASKSLYITIIGYYANLTSRVQAELMEILRYFSNTFNGQRSHLRLLRIDQDAEWCGEFLSALEKEGHLLPRIDMELHAQLNPTIVRWMETMLRENKLLQLKIETVPCQFGIVDPSHRKIARALEENKSLECLSLDTFCFSEDESTVIRSVLKKPNLRRLRLREPSSPDDCMALREVLAHSACPITELALVVQPSFWSSEPQGSTFALDRPNTTVKTLRLLMRGGRAGGDRLVSILSSFHALEELFVSGSDVKCLPLPNQGSSFPKNLRTLDLSGSLIVDRWTELGTKDLAEVYGSLLQYSYLCPQLRIYGFPKEHRIFRDYPEFISQQKNIPATQWPRLFGLLSSIGQSAIYPPSPSVDHCYSVLRKYLSHQAVGLIPDITAMNIPETESR